MTSQIDLLLQDICQRMREVAGEVKSIKDKNSSQDIDVTNIKRDIEAIQVDLESIRTIVNEHSKMLESIQNTKKELSGFIKYGKLVWILFMALVGYLSSYLHITFK